MKMHAGRQRVVSEKRENAEIHIEINAFTFNLMKISIHQSDRHSSLPVYIYLTFVDITSKIIKTNNVI